MKSTAYAAFLLKKVMPLMGVGVLALSLSVMAEDRTVTEDWTLTQDEAVDGSLILPAGVTVDLNGHRLTVNGLHSGSAPILTDGDGVQYEQLEYVMVRSADGRIANLHTLGSRDATACYGTGWKEYIGGIIASHAKEYGLSYIKLDLAIATSAYIYDPAWSGCYAKEHPGHRDRPESFDVIYSNCLDMFDRVHRDAPGAYIDCTFESAGKLQLVDYGLLRHADGNWLSNIGEGMRGNNPHRLETLPCRMRHIAWERSLAVPTSALVIGNLWIDDPNRILAFKSLAGAMPVMLGDPRRIPKDERAELKRLVDAFRAAGERHGFMTYRQDLPGFGEPGEGRWDGFARINTTTRSGGIVGVFRQNAVEPSRIVAVPGLDPEATYEVRRLVDGAPVASATGAELAQKGFRVAFDKPIDGELYEIARRMNVGRENEIADLDMGMVANED